MHDLVGSMQDSFIIAITLVPIDILILYPLAKLLWQLKDFVLKQYSYVKTFANEQPVKFAKYWLFTFLLGLTMYASYDCSYAITNHEYVYGYAADTNFAIKPFNQLGYIYKPFLTKFSKVSWANTVNNSSNNNQKVKSVKNPQQANFVKDPADRIFVKCSKLNKAQTDQKQGSYLLGNVLQDVLLKDKQFYIQGSNALLSYSPTQKQILQHMNLQKVVNPNLGLKYHNNKKTYTGYLNQPSYQIAHREYYPNSNVGAITGVIHGKNTNSISFVGEQLNFVPTYSLNTLHWYYYKYDDQSDLKRAMKNQDYDRSNKKIKSYHIANDPNSFGNVPTLNGHYLNSNFINPQIVINNNSVNNYQNIYTLNNTSNKYSVFNKEPINKSAIQAAMLNYNALVRMYPAIAVIAQRKYLKQLSYQYIKTHSGYNLIVYGNLHNISSQKLEHKYTATMFPFLPQKYLTFDFYDPEPHDSPDDDATVNLPQTPIKRIDDRIHYRNSDGQVAFVIKNGQIWQMALKLSHTPQSLNRKAFNIDTQNAYETDVIDYNPQYNNTGLSKLEIKNGKSQKTTIKTTQRYLSGHGSYLYQPQINKFLFHLAEYKSDVASYENRKRILKYPHYENRFFKHEIFNMHTTSNPKKDIVYY